MYSIQINVTEEQKNTRAAWYLPMLVVKSAIMEENQSESSI